MEASIDSLIKIAYKNRRYQKVLLFFCFLTWLNSNIFNTSIEVLSEPSTINDKNVSIKDCQVSPRKRTNIKLYSIVSESNFDCDFIGQLQFKLSLLIGNVIGGLLFIYFSNKLRYKKLILIASSFMIIFTTSIALIKNLTFISIMVLYCTIMTNSILCATFLLGIEMETGKKRSSFTKYVYLGLPLCELLYPNFLMRKLNFHWKSVLSFSVIVTSYLTLFFTFYTVEAPRMLLLKNKQSESIEALKYIAKWNNSYKELEEKMKSDEYRDLVLQMKNNTNVHLKEDYGKRGIKALFKSKNNFKTCMILNVIWLIINMNDPKIEQQYYIFGIILKIIAIIIISKLIDIQILGRRRTLYIICFLYAFFHFLFIFSAKKGYFKDILKISSLLLVLLLAGCESLLYTFSVESYPIHLLSTGFGLNMISGALGSALGVVLCNSFNDYINEVIHSVLILLCGILTILLKETKSEESEDNKMTIHHMSLIIGEF